MNRNVDLSEQGRRYDMPQMNVGWCVLGVVLLGWAGVAMLVGAGWALGKAWGWWG